MGQKIQAPTLEGQMSIAVEDVRLIPIDQVLDTQEPMMLPRFWNTELIPSELGGEQFGVTNAVIEVRIHGVSSIVWNFSEWAIFIGEMAYCEPLVADPEMVAYAKFQSVLPHRLAEEAHNIF